MHISYKPLWHTLVERNMRKEDLRIAAGLTTNMIANMGKGKNISMETLVRICEALNCGILDVIELENDEIEKPQKIKQCAEMEKNKSEEKNQNHSYNVLISYYMYLRLYFFFDTRILLQNDYQSRYDGVIEQIHSTVDKDSDGIDDQIDILQGALNYIASKPKYKSKYYQTGYPNDEYGVCTDVVANALNNAGYDLMILIQRGY